MKKNLITIFMVAIILCACGTNANPDVSYPNTSYPNPSEETTSDSDTDANTQADYLPKPDDAFLTRGEAYIDSRDLLTMESYPLQFMLSLKGSTPSPCHQLRLLVNAPDFENKILVEVYSVSDPNKVCAQVLSPFEVNIPLGSFAPGYYILLINGQQAAEFEA
jgi:hypothetical protein